MKNKKIYLKQSISYVLRALARLMIANGLAFREFSELAKQAFYQAGCDIISEEGGKNSHSHLSVLTGLHRKDIALLSDQQTKTEMSDEKPRSIGAGIVAEWLTNPKYLEKDGTPKKLQYASGSVESFSDLAMSISTDVRPRALLDELSRIGVVEIDENNMVSLSTSSFIPAHDTEEKYAFFARNIGDHIHAATENMLKNPSPYFDRCAYHDSVQNLDINILKNLLETEGMALLKKAYKISEGSVGKNENSQRVTVGLYMYSCDKSKNPSLEMEREENNE